MNKSLQKILSSAIAFIMLITSVLSGTVITFAESDIQITSDISNDDDKRGNFDGDEAVTANDAATLLLYILDKSQKDTNKYLKELSEEMILWLGDVDGSGSLSANDVSQILKKSMGGFDFTGPLKPKPGESTTTDSAVTTTTEEPIVTTTEAIVNGPAQDAIYNGYDVVVDARAVSDPDREGQPIFKTVREAVEAAGKGGKEEKPFVIGIVPGVYREQIILNKPWITFKKITNSTSEAEDATLTWYYLEGYTYDNVGANKLWDPDNPEINKGGNNSVESWGRSTWIQKGATGFRAEGIYFENSANLYVTQEELDANVRVNPTNTGVGGAPSPELPQRNALKAGYGNSNIITVNTGKEGLTKNVIADVRAEAWRERGCALYTEADKVTYIDCRVVSSQDTIGTGGRAYFKNCYLAGHVDFLCGGGQILFDECNIHWQSSPYEGTGGHLTAASTGAYPERGYLFYNCRISGEDKTTNVDFGRPWGGTNTETVWVNTKADESKNSSKNEKDKGNTNLVCLAGWAKMGSTEPEDARFFEYNTMNSAGESILTDKVKAARRGHTIEEKGIINGILDDWTVIRYNPYEYTAAYLDRSDLSNLKIAYDNWDPTNSKSIYEPIKAAADEAIVIPERFEDNEDGQNTFTLPDAPDGYEVKYIIDNEEGRNFASIGEDGKTVTFTRPIFGQPDAKIDFIAYFKKVGTITGVEKEFSTNIACTKSTEGTFSTKGTISFIIPPKEDIDVTLTFNTAAGMKVLEKVLTVPANSKTFDYELEERLPASEYNVLVALSNKEFSVKDGEIKNFTAAANDEKVLDIAIGKTELRTVSLGVNDLKKSSDNLTNITAEEVTANGRDCLKIEEKANSNDDYMYIDLGSIVDSVRGVADQKNIKITFNLTYDSQTTMPDEGIYKLTSQLPGVLNNNTEASRYLQASPKRGYHVIRWYGSNGNDRNNGIDGKKDKFADEGNGNAAIYGYGNWQDFTVNIDMANKKISNSVTGTGANGELSASKTYNSYPTDLNNGKLYFVIWPKTASTTYINGITISYDTFIEGEGTDTVSVSGTSQNIAKLTFVNSEQEAFTHIAEIAEDGTISFDKDPVPKGNYRIDYVCKDGYVIKSIKLGETPIEPDSNGKYFIDVTETVSNLEIIAEGIPGFDNAIKAVNDAMNKYAVKTGEGENAVYALKEAIPQIEEYGYTIEINEGCDYVNTDGSLAEKTSSQDNSAKKLIFTITNKSMPEGTNKETLEFNVTPKTKDNIFYYSSFEGLAVNSQVTNNGYSADIVKNEQIGADRGNVLEFKNSSGTNNDKVDAVAFENIQQGKTYAVSFDVLRTDVSGSGTGWRINLGNSICAMWNGETLNFNHEFIHGTNYAADNETYPATKNIIDTTSANKWYKLAFVFNTAAKNVDVYVDNSYVTSCQTAENGLPSYIQFATHYIPKGSIFLDNVKVYEYPNGVDIQDDLNTALENIDIPTEFSDAATENKVITVPAITSKGYNINWTSTDNDKTLIDIANGANSNEKAVTIKVPAINSSEKITATVEYNFPYAIYPNTTKVSASKEYPVKFTASNVVKHNFKVTNSTPNSGLEVTVIKGDTTVVEKTAVDDTNGFTQELDAGKYAVKFSFGENTENYYVTSVKNGTTEITESEDGSYEVNLSEGDITFAVTSEKVDFSEIKAAITAALEKSADKDETADVWSIKKALTLPASDDFTVTIAENSAIDSDGTLKDAFKTDGSTVEVTFTITHKKTNFSDDFKASFKSAGYLVYEDFDNLTAGPVENNGKLKYTIVSTEDRGNYFKFNEDKTNNSNANVTVVDFSKTPLEDNKVYEISFDVMRVVEGGNSFIQNESRGWNIAFTEKNYSKHFRYGSDKFMTLNGDNKDTEILTGCTSEGWYTLKFVVDTANKNIDVFSDGQYKASTAFIEDEIKNLNVYSNYGKEIANDYICFDNVTVREINTNFEDDFNNTMASVTDFPDTSVKIEEVKTVKLPAKTQGGKEIDWSTDKENIIEMSLVGDKYTVTLNPKKGPKATLTAKVISDEYSYDGTGVSSPIVYKKDYLYTFATDGEFNIMGNVAFDHEMKEGTKVKIRVLDSTGALAFYGAEYIVETGAGNYGISNVPVNSAESPYKIDVQIIDGKAENAVRLICDGTSEQNPIVDVVGTKSEMKTINIKIGEVEDCTLPLTPENFVDNGTITKTSATDEQGNSYYTLTPTNSGDYIYYDLGENKSDFAKGLGQIKVTYDVTFEDANNKKNTDSFILLSKKPDTTPSVGQNQEDKTRYAAKQLVTSWSVFAIFDSVGNRTHINNNDLKFADGDTEMFGWKNWQTLTTTINWTDSTIKENVHATSDETKKWDNSYSVWPTETDGSNLVFLIQPVANSKMRVKNITITYPRWKPTEATAGYSARGTVDDGIETIQLQSKGRTSNAYFAEIDNGKFVIKNVPMGEYDVIIETASGKEITSVNGLLGNEKSGYSIIVNDDVNDIVISTAAEENDIAPVSADVQEENSNESSPTEENSSDISLDAEKDETDKTSESAENNVGEIIDEIVDNTIVSDDFSETDETQNDSVSEDTQSDVDSDNAESDANSENTDTDTAEAA